MLFTRSGWRVAIQPAFKAAAPSKTVREIPTAKNIDQIGRTCEDICNTMTNYISENPEDFHLILGGDHCIPIGTIPALVSKRPNTGIIWVDAHADSKYIVYCRVRCIGAVRLMRPALSSQHARRDVLG